MILVGVAGNPKTPSYVLKDLANDKGTYVRQAVACNQNTPVSTLEDLAGDKEECVFYAAMHNPKLPPHYLATISKGQTEKSRGKRLAQASSPQTPIKVLEKLALSDDYLVRSRVAENPNAPAHVLELLANYDAAADDRNNNSVLWYIARHHNTPVSLLRRLATHPNEGVRGAVAHNDNTPHDVLEGFLNDPAIRGYVIHNHHLQLHHVRDVDPDHRKLRMISNG